MLALRSTRLSQAGATTIRSYWLQRGLQIVFSGQRLIYVRNAAQNLTINGGPKSVASARGIAQGFGSTFGTGTTDCIQAPAILQRATSRSVVAHVYKNGTGGGGFGRIWNVLSASSGSEYLYTGSSDFLNYQRYCQSLASMVGYVSTGTVATGSWSVQGMSLDLIPVSPAANCLFYKDGVLVTSTSPSSSVSTWGDYGPNPIDFGNRASDGARVWDGMLGIVLIFGDAPMLTDAEHSTLAANPWQIFR